VQHLVVGEPDRPHAAATQLRPEVVPAGDETIGRLGRLTVDLRRLGHGRDALSCRTGPARAAATSKLVSWGDDVFRAGAHRPYRLPVIP